MLLLFIVLNFIISAVSDIGLNILSRLRTSPEAVRALKPYFQNHSLLISAGYAGITVVTVLVITMLIRMYPGKTFLSFSTRLPFLV